MKVSTWNVQWFCGLDDVVDIARVVEAAKAMADFDVICMQEVAMNYPPLKGNAAHDLPAILTTLLPGFDVFFGTAVDELAPDGKSRQRFGNILASRLPVAQVGHYTLPYPADAAPGGVRSMPRMCTSATVLTEFGPVRAMPTHLEFYSLAIRRVQARELLRLHAQGCALAAHPPLLDDAGGPFQSKPHTAHCILTRDFNFEPTSDEYASLQSKQDSVSQLHDAWTTLNHDQPHAPTFRQHDRRYGRVPIACDFLFVSDTLAPHLKRIAVNLDTRVSDHQPVLLKLA